MRTMLLSFKPEIYKKIANGEKIYEHRRVFPDEPIKAYAYISSPIKAIAGVMVLDNRINMNEWLTEYADDLEAVDRIKDYLTRSTYAMEIQSFQDTNRIYLDEIRQKFPKFVCPQMYYFLDELPLLDFLKDNIKAEGQIIQHSFENIESRMICRH